MTVRAKFRVESVTDYGNDQKTVKLTAAVHGDDNKTWAKWTPSGSLEMAVTNPDAHNQFTPGAYFFLDFTPVEKNP